MKKTVDVDMFKQAFKNVVHPFSFTGLERLFEHLESLEEDGHDEFELNPFEFVRDYIEYSHPLECMGRLGIKWGDIGVSSIRDPLFFENLKEYLLSKTNVISCDLNVILIEAY